MYIWNILYTFIIEMKNLIEFNSIFLRTMENAFAKFVFALTENQNSYVAVFIIFFF